MLCFISVASVVKKLSTSEYDVGNNGDETITYLFCFVSPRRVSCKEELNEEEDDEEEKEVEDEEEEEEEEEEEKKEVEIEEEVVEKEEEEEEDEKVEEDEKEEEDEQEVEFSLLIVPSAYLEYDFKNSVCYVFIMKLYLVSLKVNVFVLKL